MSVKTVIKFNLCTCIHNLENNPDGKHENEVKLLKPHEVEKHYLNDDNVKLKQRSRKQLHTQVPVLCDYNHGRSNLSFFSYLKDTPKNQYD